MSGTLREIIITSETANRMLSETTPIYDNSLIALYMFEAMGREFDDVAQIVAELPRQLNPETATWLLPLWERRFGITTDETLSLEERRRKIRLRRKHIGAFNPHKVKEWAENMTGVPARVVEFVDSYTFAVYLAAMTSDDEKLRKTIRTLKPSHLTCQLIYEQGVPGELFVGGNISQYVHFVLTQVN